jgi:hypothetical protein
MKIRFHFLILAGLLLVASVPAQAQLYYKSGTFDVLKAEHNTLFPGVQGAPIVDNYTLTLRFKRNTTFMVDSAWAKGRADKLEIAYANGNAFTGRVRTGDVLIIRLRIYTATAEPGTPGFEHYTGSPTTEPPRKHRGQLLFRYGFVDLRYGFSVMNIIQRESVYAP